MQVMQRCVGEDDREHSNRVRSTHGGISNLMLSAFVRIATHPRVFIDSTPVHDALAFARLIRTSSYVVALQPGARQWTIFERLCTAVGARGNVVPDAFLAALVIEAGATWYTADRGFTRFPGAGRHAPTRPRELAQGVKRRAVGRTWF